MAADTDETVDSQTELEKKRDGKTGRKLSQLRNSFMAADTDRRDRKGERER